MGDRGKQQVKTKDIHTPKKRLKTSSKKKKKRMTLDHKDQ